MSGLTYAVITKVADPATGGNLANGAALYVQVERPSEANGWGGRYESAYDAAPGAMTALVLAGLAYPVFEVGELLVLDHNGREPCGYGRKPSKWVVEYEEFGSIEDAVRRAREVSRSPAAPSPRGGGA